MMIDISWGFVGGGMCAPTCAEKPIVLPIVLAGFRKHKRKFRGSHGIQVRKVYNWGRCAYEEREVFDNTMTRR